jgi:hypothetical protein
MSFDQLTGLNTGGSTSQGNNTGGSTSQGSNFPVIGISNCPSG